jgi:hypothetical protein
MPKAISHMRSSRASPLSLFEQPATSVFQLVSDLSSLRNKSASLFVITGESIIHLPIVSGIPGSIIATASLPGMTANCWWLGAIKDLNRTKTAFFLGVLCAFARVSECLS